MLNVLPNANTSLSVNLDRSAPLQYIKSSLIVSHRHCQRSSSSKTSSHTQQDTSRFGRKSICLRAQTVVAELAGAYLLAALWLSYIYLYRSKNA